MSDDDARPAKPDLLPCPFCGCALVKARSTAHGEGCLAWFVFCGGCGCEGPWFKHESSARGAWNRRVPTEGGES